MKYMRNKRPIGHRQRGFYLIEALVAALILAIGLLSVAILQIIGLKNTDSAALYSQATGLATEAIDRMRINRASALAGDYDVAIGTVPSGATIEAQDMIGWKAAMDGRLPSGDGAVDCTTTPGLCVVTVQWDDRRGTSGRRGSIGTDTAQVTLRTLL